MTAATNKRIFYAVQAVAIKGDGNASWSASHIVKGVQSVGMTTSFNLDQVFELGQLSIYENIEGIPNIEVTLNKVLDGRPLLWHLATVDATTPTLVGRSTAKCIFGLGIFADTAEEASAATPSSEVECSGMYPSSSAFTIPIDSSMTEDLSLVGNNKVWANDTRINSNAPGLWSGATGLGMAAGFTAGSVDSPGGVGGVNQRENVIFTINTGLAGDANGMYADPDCTILPPEVFGIDSSGINQKSNGSDFDCHAQSMSVSVDLGRDEQFELGRRGPFNRTVNFPVEVTFEIEVTATSGDMISATEPGILSTGTSTCGNANNLSDRTIRIATCEGTRIYLGVKNKLSSVNYGGGDAGGGNVSVTYTYTNFNDYTILHSGDPNASGTAWWAARTTYLVTT